MYTSLKNTDHHFSTASRCSLFYTTATDTRNKACVVAIYLQVSFKFPWEWLLINYRRGWSSESPWAWSICSIRVDPTYRISIIHLAYLWLVIIHWTSKIFVFLLHHKTYAFLLQTIETIVFTCDSSCNKVNDPGHFLKFLPILRSALLPQAGRIPIAAFVTCERTLIWQVRLLSQCHPVKNVDFCAVSHTLLYISIADAIIISM